MLSNLRVVPSPTFKARLIDSFNVSIPYLCMASLSAFFFYFSSFCSQYDSNFILTMSQSCCSSVCSEASLVMFYSSIACSNSSWGIWFARLNLSSSRSGTRSSSSENTIGYIAKVSFDLIASPRGASAYKFSNTLNLDSLVLGHEQSPTTLSLPFHLLSTMTASK